MVERVAQGGIYVEYSSKILRVAQGGVYVEYSSDGLEDHPPTDLICSVVSSVQINLSWNDNSSDEVGFKIERALTDAGPWDQIDTVGAGVTAYEDTGLAPNETYCYRVRAYK